MTSEARESSLVDGKPVHFVRFTRRTKTWYYTSSDREESHGGDVYMPAPITRDAIRQGSERAKLNLKITVPSTLAVAENWRPYPSVDPIAVTWFVRHVGETDVIVEWVGRVTAPKFMGAKLELVCSPSSSSARRLGALRCWQRGCGVAHYSKGSGMCNLDPEPIPVAGTVATLDGTTVTAAAFAAAPRTLAGRTLHWVDSLDQPQQRQILTHAGTTITIDAAGDDLTVGTAVTAYTIPLWREAMLTAASGSTLTADEFGAFPSGRLSGGFLQWDRDDGLVEYRSIMSHDSNIIATDYGAVDLAPDLVVRAYPGCAHTWADCGYYDNQENYPGDLWIPQTNPYAGNPI